MKGIARGVVVFLTVVHAWSAIAATRTWTGAASNLWSNAANWGGTAPVAGDDLVFPAGAAHLANSNDLGAGFAVHSITISGGNYALSGQSIALGAGGLNFLGLPSGANVNVNLPIALSVAQQWTSDSIAIISIDSKISGSSNLAATGFGTFYLTGVNTATGVLSWNGPGSLWIAGEWDGTVSFLGGGGYLTNNSIAGPLTVNSTYFAPAASSFLGTPAAGSCGNLDLQSGSTFVAYLSDNPTLHVSGTVHISNTTLTVMANVVPAGTALTLIDNDGSDAFTGTFNGVPEGATVVANSGQSFKVSYVGGTGNDLVLTAGPVPAAVPALDARALAALAVLLAIAGAFVAGRR